MKIKSEILSCLHIVDICRDLFVDMKCLKILNIEGSIVECGVWNGAGLLSYAKLVEIFEPYSIKRKVIGFDTFEGFVDIQIQKI